MGNGGLTLIILLSCRSSPEALVHFHVSTHGRRLRLVTIRMPFHRYLVVGSSALGYTHQSLGASLNAVHTRCRHHKRGVVTSVARCTKRRFPAKGTRLSQSTRVMAPLCSLS